jgi:hypothetical protein
LEEAFFDTLPERQHLLRREEVIRQHGTLAQEKASPQTREAFFNDRLDDKIIRRFFAFLDTSYYFCREFPHHHQWGMGWHDRRKA